MNETRRADHSPWVNSDGIDLLPGSGTIGERMIANELDLDRVIDTWESVAPSYIEDYRFKRFTPNMLVDMPVVESVLNSGVDGARVLEVGSGPGHFVDHIHKLGDPDEIIALEPSVVMVDRMNQVIEENGYDHVAIVNKSIEHCGLEGEKFDLIVALNVLDILPDLRQSLAIARELLADGGKFVAMIRHPKRNELMALKGSGSYVPGYSSFYREFWPGAPEGVLSRYMTWDQWVNEFAYYDFKIRGAHPAYASDGIRMDHSEIWEIYNRHNGRPGGLVFDITG